MQIRIVRWDEQYEQNFIRLSEEWLTKYVSIEPADIEILYHPHEAILDNGGMVFFALDENTPIGCVAMIPVGRQRMELAKLAVTEAYKGHGIGALLMQAALDYAGDQEAEEVMLYTNRKLIPAIRLYKKFGFEEIPLGDNKYLESDMKMILRKEK